MAVTARESVNRASDAASAFAQSLNRRFTGKAGRRLLAAAPPTLEIALTIGVGLALVSLFYALFAPLPAPERLPAGIAAVAKAEPQTLSSTPFRTAAIAAAAPAAEETEFQETRLDLKLHGVFIDPTDPALSHAIISTPNSRQGHFRTGDQIWNNVTLDRILSPEQVVITSAGVQETLTLINRDPREAAAARRRLDSAPVARESTTGAGVQNVRDPKTFLSRVVNISRSQGAQGPRLVLQPGEDRAAFDATGFKAGDVVVSVNGRRVDGSTGEALRQLAQSGGNLALIVERNGVAVPVTVNLGKLQGGDGDDDQ